MNNIDKLKKKYNDNEMFLMGALDCFGVPHTPDNTEVKSYIDMVADDMTTYGLNVNYVNLHSLGCNKTFSLKRIIDSDYQKQEYYDINLVQTKKAIAKEEIFPFPVNPRFLKDYYKDTNNPTMKITSHYCESKNPIFFYSCGQMNFHSYVKMRSNDIKQIAPELLLRFNDNFEKTMSDIKLMVDYLTVLNPTVEIYMFGVYPMFESKLMRYGLAPIYAGINRKVASYFEEYDNIHFVDVMGNINHVAKNDCHPNFKGQCYMKNRVMNVIDKSLNK